MIETFSLPHYLYKGVRGLRLASLFCYFFPLQWHFTKYVSWYYQVLRIGSNSKESAHSVGDPASIPGLEKSPGEKNGNTLQCSCLGNSKDRGAWWATVHGVTNSQTWLDDFYSLTVCLLSFFGYGNKPDQEGLCSQRAYILVGQRSDNKINVK